MKFKNLLFPILIAMLTLNCAASSQSRSFGEVVDDEVIALSLKTKYMKDKGVPAKDVSIKVWRGIVTLKGELAEQEQINRAVELAELQKGVKEVKAFLVLKEFGELRETKTQSKLEKEPFYKKIFRSNGGSKFGKNKDTLKEKDLLDESSGQTGAEGESEMVASETPAVRKKLEEEPETDNLDEEEEF